MSGRRRKYWARRPFKYAGQELDRGQVFHLVGATNDEKLIRMEYIVILGAKAETYECSECGAEFVEMGMRTSHGNKRHGPRAIDPDKDPAAYDRAIEREMRQMEQLAPLNVGG